MQIGEALEQLDEIVPALAAPQQATPLARIELARMASATSSKPGLLTMLNWVLRPEKVICASRSSWPASSERSLSRSFFSASVSTS